MSQSVFSVAFGLCYLRLARTCGPPSPTSGTCYVGYLRAVDPPYLSQTEVCSGPQNNWCMISYDPTTKETYYNCYDYWRNSGQCNAIPRPCGDGLQDTNHGGCSQIFPFGRSLTMCCCKGGNCNSPGLFNTALELNNHSTSLQQSYVYTWNLLIVTIWIAAINCEHGQ